MDVEDRNECISYYHSIGMSQRDIVFTLLTNHSLVISERHLRRILKTLDLYRRRNYTDIEEVTLYINNTLSSGQKHGYRWFYHKCEAKGFIVRKEDVRLIVCCLDPLGVSARKSRRLQRRSYSSNGPNYCWHLDGYDKLKPFGLCVSGCVDGFSRKVIWLNVYTTNNNPKVIRGYYIESLEKLKACPTKVRGDCGTENVYVKQFQNFLLREGRNEQQVAYLEGTSTANERIECFWGHLRKQCIEKWIITLHMIQSDGQFTGDFLDKELILICFLAHLQVYITHTHTPGLGRLI